MAWAGAGVRLLVPYRSQLDGSPYAGANCGPAVMGMVLAAYGREVPTADLRALVNDLQGTWGRYDEGTFIQNLAVIAERYGLRALDLYDGRRLRRWTLEDVRRHLRAGHPVVPQVRFRDLPGRQESPYRGDHYIVITGYEGEVFLYNDPIDRDGPGMDRRISAAQFERAWRNADPRYARAALAVAGPNGGLTPVPSPTPTATPSPTATPTITPSPTVMPAPSATPTPPAVTVASPLPPSALSGDGSARVAPGGPLAVWLGGGALLLLVGLGWGSRRQGGRGGRR